MSSGNSDAVARNGEGEAHQYFFRLPSIDEEVQGARPDVRGKSDQIAPIAREYELGYGRDGHTWLQPGTLQRFRPDVKNDQVAVPNRFGIRVVGRIEQSRPRLHALQNRAHGVGELRSKSDQGDTFPGHRLDHVFRDRGGLGVAQLGEREEQVGEDVAKTGHLDRLFAQQLFGLARQGGNLAVAEEGRTAGPLVQLPRRAQRIESRNSGYRPTAGCAPRPHSRSGAVSSRSPGRRSSGQPRCPAPPRPVQPV